MTERRKKSLDITLSTLIFIKYLLILATIAVIAVAGYSVYFLTRHADPTELFLFMNSSQPQGKPGSPIVFLRDASKSLPLAKKAVDIQLQDKSSGRIIAKQKLTTDKNGLAVFNPGNLPYGSYKIKAMSGKIKAEREFNFTQAIRCMVTTDKPVYSHGQTARIRVIALDDITHKPTRTPVRINITAPDGSEILSTSKKLSEYGICTLDLIPEKISTSGLYTIRVFPQTENNNEYNQGTTAFKVGNFKPQPVFFDFNTDRVAYYPGATISGKLNITGPDSIPQSGISIKLKAAMIQKGKQKSGMALFGMSDDSPKPQHKVLKTLTGKTDSQGNFKFKVKLPSQLKGFDFKCASIQCRLTFSATHKNKSVTSETYNLDITPTPLRIHAWADFITGSRRGLYVSTSSPSGKPVPSIITLDKKSLKTNNDGIAHFTGISSPDIKIEGQTTLHDYVSKDYSYKHLETIELTTDKRIYNSGDKIKVSASCPREKGYYFIALTKGGCVLRQQGISIDSSSKELILDIPSDSSGTMKIKAFSFAPNGKLFYEIQAVQVFPKDQLIIKTDLNQAYPINRNVRAKLLLTDKHGKAVSGAFSITALNSIYKWRPVNQYNYFMYTPKLLNALPAPGSTPDRLTLSAKLARYYSSLGLAVSVSPKYHQAESVIADKKNKYIEKLINIFAPAAFILMLILVAPYVFQPRGPESFKQNSVILSDQLVKKCHSSLKYIAITALICILFVICGIPRCLIKEMIYQKILFEHYQAYELGTMSVILIIIVFIMWIFSNKIIKLFPENKRKSVTGRLIALLPILYFTAGLIALGLKCIYELTNNTTTGVIAVYVILAMCLLSLIGLRNIRRHICSEEHIPAQSYSPPCLKDGLGVYKSSGKRIWIYVFIFSYIPLGLTYIIFIMCFASVFLPMITFVTYLSGGPDNPAKCRAKLPINIFKAPPKTQYFWNCPEDDVGNSHLKIVYYPSLLYYTPQLKTDSKDQSIMSFSTGKSPADYTFTINAATENGMLSTEKRHINIKDTKPSKTEGDK